MGLSSLVGMKRVGQQYIGQANSQSDLAPLALSLAPGYEVVDVVHFY